MGQTAAAEPLPGVFERVRIAFVLKTLAWVLLLTQALLLALVDAARYFTVTQAVYGPYWPRRGWLLLHVTGAMLALLIGPFQFWTGFRQRYLHLHRWTGRIYLLGILMGSTGGFYLACFPSLGWAWGVGVFTLSSVWLTTAGMAYTAIRKGLVQIHKEWMIRSYVLTYAFVTVRVLLIGQMMLLLGSRLTGIGSVQERTIQETAVTSLWLGWVVPLFVTELLLHAKRMKQAPRTHPSRTTSDPEPTATCLG